MNPPSRLQLRVCLYRPTRSLIERVSRTRVALLIEEIKFLRRVKEKREGLVFGSSAIDMLARWSLPDLEGPSEYEEVGLGSKKEFQYIETQPLRPYIGGVKKKL